MKNKWIMFKKKSPCMWAVACEGIKCFSFCRIVRLLAFSIYYIIIYTYVTCTLEPYYIQTFVYYSNARWNMICVTIIQTAKSSTDFYFSLYKNNLFYLIFSLPSLFFQENIFLPMQTVFYYRFLLYCGAAIALWVDIYAHIIHLNKMLRSAKKKIIF